MTLCPTVFGNTQSHFIWLYETGYDAKTITFDLLTHCKKFKCSKNMHFKKNENKKLVCNYFNFNNTIGETIYQGLGTQMTF